MKNRAESPTSSRQRYLALISRLYELAADHTGDELREMIDSWAGRDQLGLRSAIEALIELHGESRPLQSIEHVTPKRLTRPPSGGAVQSNRTEAGSTAVNLLQPLEEALSDEVLFPKTADIASVFPAKLRLQPKEGRARYIRRLVKSLGQLSSAEQSRVWEAISRRVQKVKDEGSFISSWERLIKEL